MSSSDHVNPQQLAMFMPAGELVALDKSSDARLGREQNLWEAQQPWTRILYDQVDRHGNNLIDDTPDGDPGTMHDSIRNRGVVEPVVVDTFIDSPNYGPDGTMALHEGNHRVAVAYDIDPNTEVPVTHREFRDPEGRDDE